MENIAAKILLVDDAPHILEFLEIGLKNEGFEVMTAQDGHTALELCQTYKPDLAILDAMMPGLDGFEVCSRIKSSTDRTSVMMLTARDEAEDRRYGFSLGADDYMTKPFKFNELLSKIYARVLPPQSMIGK